GARASRSEARRACARLRTDDDSPRARARQAAGHGRSGNRTAQGYLDCRRTCAWPRDDGVVKVDICLRRDIDPNAAGAEMTRAASIPVPESLISCLVGGNFHESIWQCIKARGNLPRRLLVRTPT